MKFGKYEISEWIDTESSLSFISCKRKIFIDNQRSEINIHRATTCLEPNVFVNTSNVFINDTYKLMYKKPIYVKNFYTVEDAKQYVDNFLNRLQRLKAFL